MTYPFFSKKTYHQNFSIITIRIGSMARSAKHLKIGLTFTWRLIEVGEALE
jgi:hypothetical protein